MLRGVLSDPVVARQRVNPAAASLIDPLLKKHRVNIGQIRLIGGQEKWLPADSNSLAHESLSLVPTLAPEQACIRSKTYTILLLIKDRIAFDLPAYEGLLAGHYRRGKGYSRKRLGGTDDWLLIMTLDGMGRIGTDRGDHRAAPDTLCLIGPGANHDYGTARTKEVWEILWVHFHPPASWLPLLQWPPVGSGIFSLSLDQPSEIKDAFQEVLLQSTAAGALRRAFAMNALERLLLLCWETLPLGSDAFDERVATAIRYMQNHLSQRISLDELSRQVHLSPSRFSHLFRQATGMAPGQFLAIQRLQQAQTLLKRTTLPVAQIAARVGMDPFYLSLRLKKETGKSPRDLRKIASSAYPQ
jgi:AraC family transcriptional regulator of arabinose operon